MNSEMGQVVQLDVIMGRQQFQKSNAIVGRHVNGNIQENALSQSKRCSCIKLNYRASFEQSLEATTCNKINTIQKFKVPKTKIHNIKMYNRRRFSETVFDSNN